MHLLETPSHTLMLPSTDPLQNCFPSLEHLSREEYFAGSMWKKDRILIRKDQFFSASIIFLFDCNYAKYSPDLRVVISCVCWWCATELTKHWVVLMSYKRITGVVVPEMR